MHLIRKWNVSYLWTFSFLSIRISWAFRNGQIELIFWHEICAKCLQQYTRTGDFNLFFEIAIIIIKISLLLRTCIACDTEKVTEQKKKKEERNWNYLPILTNTTPHKIWLPHKGPASLEVFLRVMLGILAQRTPHWWKVSQLKSSTASGKGNSLLDQWSFWKCPQIRQQRLAYFLDTFG